MPEEKGPFNINMDTVARYGLGGLAAGAGGAAALNLVHLISKLNKKRKEVDPTATDENTIVLTLPKRAADIAELGVNAEGTYNDKPETTGKLKGNAEEGIKGDPHQEPVKVESVEGAKVKEKKAASDAKGTMYEEGIKAEEKAPAGEGPEAEGGIAGDPSKEPLGRKPAKETTESTAADSEVSKDHNHEKKANWPTLTAAMLAAGAGGATGIMLVNKAYEMKRIKDKEKELEKAKEEYLDRLTKGASTPFLDNLFEKTAVQADDKRTFGIMDYPMGLGALMLLLGAGGTGYITKRILDAGTDTAETKPKKPRIKRIVFQTGEEKQSSADQDAIQGTIDATVGIFADIVSGEPDVLLNEKCAAYLERRKIMPSELYKQAQSDFDNLVNRIYGDDELRNTIQRAYLEAHPIGKFFKWGLKLPGISNLADRSMYSKLKEVFQPRPMFGEPLPEGLGKTSVDKQAFLGSNLADIAASFYGSTIANKAEELNAEEAAAEEAAVEEEEAAETPEERATKLLSGLEVHAKDPKAARFVQKNREQILAALNTMAQEGKL